MRIGFDVSQTGRLKAGCGYFADGLIRELAKIDSENQYILYPAVGDLYWDPDCATSTFSTDRPNFSRAPAPKDFGESQQFWRNPPEDFEERLGRPDIIHVNNFFCPKVKRARLVYTLYDLSYLEEPAWTSEGNRTGCFQGSFGASVLADRLIAISEHSRRHFLEVFPHYPKDRIATVYPGSRFERRSSVARPERFAELTPDAFWLSVATLEPRKNHKKMLEAYVSLPAEIRLMYPLVLAGGRGWLMEEFEAALTGLNRDVKSTGYVSDAELQWLYENCFAFLYPSLFEGFGLPVLEAMSLGAVVIASNSTSIPEIVGSAGILVDPHEVEEIAETMRRLATGEICREPLRSLAASRARTFSWPSAARQVLELYADLASAKASSCGERIR